MAVGTAFVVGVGIACFVAYNVGGATTGPAFGPAVGADVVSKRGAAILMSVCFFLGAWTLGRRVVTTLGEGLVRDPSVFTLTTSIGVLFFIGGALLIGNLSGAPASTSMTAVGAIAGLGLASGELNAAVVGEIAVWWIVSPVAGFWISLVVGRYLYPYVVRIVSIDRSEGPLLVVDASGPIPLPAPAPETTRRELVGTLSVIGIGCLMAFSSGASNIANAIAPLVGSGRLGMNAGILIGSAAVAVGAFTIARRTMETLGNDIADLPLTAAIVVAVVSSGLVVLLSALGIPASFVIIATLSIAGLGWGRASRTFTVEEAVRGDIVEGVSVDTLAAEAGGPTVTEPDRETPSAEPSPVGDADAPTDDSLFDPATTVRVVAMQHLVPALATVGSYATFRALAVV
ncbi:inorganic phosphate transporter [Halorubrum salipaludis]|uniref:Phosphate transporter n=1 Tax=Halorubrum salipaludis TaxID=2032630 RepID=A0A2A2FI50_9EURY|nr:inorganic phosphate transporter [Halorubrum salipaludis]PAU84322.1 inorganic phosphate transporter [Halorubrum salipaludis]